jgi:hypothetical protein
MVTKGIDKLLGLVGVFRFLYSISALLPSIHQSPTIHIQDLAGDE